MKNLSTGFGLALLAGAILAYPFVSSLAPSANASAVSTAASAVSIAAAAQSGPTIVWYGTESTNNEFHSLYRAWSDGRIEMRRVRARVTGVDSAWCDGALTCSSPWFVVSDPAQGLTYRSDINFDEKVDGADLGALLADWGDAPRQDMLLSDCPLNLVNP
jgi:hypothetical protein